MRGVHFQHNVQAVEDITRVARTRFLD